MKVYGEDVEIPADSCFVSYSGCICWLKAGHGDPHTCPCGGMWEIGEDGERVVVTFPGGRTRDQTINSILAFLGWDPEEDS